MNNRATIAAIALGSNLGDRRRHLEFARSRLGSLLSHMRFSSVLESEPVGVPDRQPPYLNAAAVGETALGARELLAALQQIEQAAGRERPFAGAARTLDLDLILLGSTVVTGPDLTVPHPRFRERWFVLAPLSEIAPDLRDPTTSLTIAELLARLPQGR